VVVEHIASIEWDVKGSGGVWERCVHRRLDGSHVEFANCGFGFPDFFEASWPAALVSKPYVVNDTIELRATLTTKF
jgi:hypothetical protein